VQAGAGGKDCRGRGESGTRRDRTAESVVTDYPIYDRRRPGSNRPVQLRSPRSSFRWQRVGSRPEFRRLIRACCLFAALVVTSSAPAALRLIATVDGECVEIRDLGVNRFLGDDGRERRAVPSDAVLALDGNLAENAALVRWIATCYLVHAPGRDRRPDQRPWFGYVRLVNGSGWNGPSLDEIWPKRPAEPLLAVFAWCVGGKVTQTHVQRLPADSRDASFRVDQLFALSEAEAAGFGVVLLWSKGKFIAPKPYFSNAGAEAALHAMMAGRPADFEAALEKLKGAFFRPGDHLLWQAAERGNDAAVAALLRTGIKADNVFDPLPRASRAGRADVLDRLLQGRTLKNPELAIPLRYGHDAAVRRLLAHAAPSFRPSPDMVEAALEGGFADIARDLIGRGGRVEVDAAARCARLLATLIKDGKAAAAQVLLDQKADPNRGVDGKPPLFLAVQLGEHALVDALLRAGAKPNSGDPAGTTPLMVACQANDLALARRLLEHGADAGVRRQDGMTAMHFAAPHLAPDIVHLLLARGAAAATEMQPTPLEFALLAGASGAVEALAARGARLDLKRPQVWRALEAAIRMDQLEIVRDALDRGWKPAAGWPAVWSADVTAALAGATRVRAALTALQPEAAPPEVPQRVPAEKLDVPLQPLRAPTLVDPREGRSSGAAAIVELQVVVDQEGRLQAPRVRQSPDGRLSFLALQTLAQWRLSPPRLDGAAVCTEVVLPIAFPPPNREVFDRAEVDAAPCRITFRTPLTPLVVERVGNAGYSATPAALENDVRLQVVITTRGEVVAPRVINRVENYEGSATLRAIGDWAFTPGMRDGKVVATRSEVVFER